MDLKSNYLGLELKNPIVPSAGPLTADVNKIRLMEDNGAAAVVLYSLFEEQIEHESLELFHYTTTHNDAYQEAQNYFPEWSEYKAGPDQYLEHIRKAKEAVSIPVIASLNGHSAGGWTKFAKLMQDAGADALELNIYNLVSDIEKTGADVEKEYAEIVSSVTSEVKIPVSVKIGPFFSSIGNVAKQLEDSGAKGIVLFNRFYQPDIDLEKLEVVPNVLLSTPWAMRLPLRWTAILYGRTSLDIAATSGVCNELDVLKMTMAGASVTQMLSCLLKFGIPHIKDVLVKIERWMVDHEYESLNQMRGSMSYRNVKDPSVFARANYMKVLNSVTL